MAKLQTKAILFLCNNSQSLQNKYQSKDYTILSINMWKSLRSFQKYDWRKIYLWQNNAFLKEKF